MMNTKICHICQDFASHDTASCPNSVCKICHQRGHVSKNCHQKTFVQPSKNVSFDEALLPFTPTKVGQVISDSKATKFQAFLTNYQRPEDDPSDPTFQPKNKVRKLDACADLEWAKNEDFSGIPLQLPATKRKQVAGSDVVNAIVNNDLGLQEISNFIDQVSSATSGMSIFVQKFNSFGFFSFVKIKFLGQNLSSELPMKFCLL